MMRLHERTATRFDTGEVLNDAVNIAEQRKINDMAVVEFDYPADEKGRLIKENMLVSCKGRIYEVTRITRRMSGTDIFHILAEDIFSYRAKRSFIPTMGDYMGKKPKMVLSEAIGKVTGFSLFTEAELQERGMTWIDFEIDVFTVDKVSLWDYIQDIIENCGRGELYREECRFALVERIGKDNGVRITLSKNAKNIEIERSTEDLINKLYAFGADDAPISDANGGVPYIESIESIEKYGLHTGYRDYSDYVEPADILECANWEFSPKNPDRIDIPKITITGKIADLSKLKEYGNIEKIELGDTVHVFDTDGTEYKERVIEMIQYPFEPKEPTISIGHMRRLLGYDLYLLRQKRRELEAVQTTSKQITTRKLEGFVNTDRNMVQAENKLLQIDGDLLSIYNKSGRRRLELGNVSGEFALNIYDEDGKQLKIKLGDHGDNYAFAIYDGDGNPAVYMDEKGEVIIAGTIKTGKHGEIGAELKVGAATEDPVIHLWGMNQDYCTISCSGADDKHTLIDSVGNLILRGSMGLYKDSVNAGNEILTQRDIQELRKDVNDLKIKVGQM